MRRGFKSDAERKSCSFRNTLGLSDYHPLAARSLANHLHCIITRPDRMPGLDPTSIMVLNTSGNGWSAITLATTPTLIIHNGGHSDARQESDLMHELAHIICEHSFATLEFVPGIFRRVYPGNDEDEANYLGACLQIPRQALLWALYEGMSDEDIASYFGASIEMVRFRKNTTGVMRQINRSKWN